MTKIESEYGSGNLQTAYEYGYNAGGARVWKRDLLNQQEYRYLCRIGCGGVPMRVYNRAMGEVSWNTLEEYVETPTAVWYGAGAESFSDYPMAAGQWLMSLTDPAAGVMLLHDTFEIQVLPNGLFGFEEEYADYPDIFLSFAGLHTPPPMSHLLVDYRFSYLCTVDSFRTWIIAVACILACAGAAVSVGMAWSRCKSTPIAQGGCQGLTGAGWWQCMINCAFNLGCSGIVSVALCVGCLLCICSLSKVRPLCNKAIDQIKKIKKIWAYHHGGRMFGTRMHAWMFTG